MEGYIFIVFHRDPYIVLYYSTYSYATNLEDLDTASYTDDTTDYAVNEKKSQSLVHKKHLHDCSLNSLITTLRKQIVTKVISKLAVKKQLQQ